MTQSELERKRPAAAIRLPVAVWQALDALAVGWGISRSKVVERLILGAPGGES